MSVFVKGMIKKLDDMWDDTRFVSEVAQSMFSDGTNNWGRIASLVAFGAVVAQHMKESGRKECVEQVAQEISTYLLTDQRDWLIKNNAWVSSERRKMGPEQTDEKPKKKKPSGGCVTAPIVQAVLGDLGFQLTLLFPCCVCRKDLWSFSKYRTQSRQSGTC